MLPNGKFEDGVIKSLIADDFEVLFRTSLSECIRRRVSEFALMYREVTDEEYESCLLTILRAIHDPAIPKAGAHRQDNWEKGWLENFHAWEATAGGKGAKINAILPRYFGKYGFLRINRTLIRPLSDNFEYFSLCLITDWLFDVYMRKAGSIYEFGCGTGYHLVRLRNYNPTASLFGLDWAPASQKIISSLASQGYVTNMQGLRFDYFNPDQNIRLAADSIVYTVASLEQLGRDFNPFLAYLLRNRPSLCVHVEPIAELLDKSNILDFLSIEYFQKRNYLTGFLDRLHALKAEGKIDIVLEQRSFIGSLLIDGYSIVVWKPV
jgi:SAM-dependent methyltransferase